MAQVTTEQPINPAQFNQAVNFVDWTIQGALLHTTGEKVVTVDSMDEQVLADTLAELVYDPSIQPPAPETEV